MVITPAEWIKEPDENGDGFLLGNAEFPIPIETHNVAPDEVTLGKPQEFRFITEAAMALEIYADEADYAARSATGLAPESYIPSGLFSPNQDESFVQTPTAIITGRVTKTYDDPVSYGFDEDDTLFTMSCLGMEFDTVIPIKLAGPEKPQVGNIVSGIYWVTGWPEDNLQE